jgi:hypothetical protein
MAGFAELGLLASFSSPGVSQFLWFFAHLIVFDGQASFLKQIFNSVVVDNAVNFTDRRVIWLKQVCLAKSDDVIRRACDECACPSRLPCEGSVFERSIMLTSSRRVEHDPICGEFVIPKRANYGVCLPAAPSSANNQKGEDER